MPFTAACAQFAPKKADIETNLDKIAEFALKASEEGADLIVFPEGAVTGYYLEGGVLEVALTLPHLAANLKDRLDGRLKAPLDLLTGFYERHEGNLYNSAGYFELGPGASKPPKAYRKFFLPTYGLFDEERFVSRGHGLGLFETRLGKVGVLICEDVWHSVLSTLLAVRGAQMILVPSASPGRGFRDKEPENHARYRRMLRALAEEHGVFALNVQLTGFEGGKGLVGGSMVLDPFGQTIAESPLQEEHLLLAQIDLDLIDIARAATPLISDLQSAWGDIKRIVDDGC